MGYGERFCVLGLDRWCTATATSPEPEERINSICRSFADTDGSMKWWEAAPGISVLQVHYLFFTMSNVLYDVTSVLVTIFPISWWNCTQIWLKAQAFVLYSGGKERHTCLDHSSSNIVCCNLKRNLFFGIKIASVWRVIFVAVNFVVGRNHS